MTHYNHWHDNTDYNPYKAIRVGQARIPGPPNIAYSDVGIDYDSNTVNDFSRSADHIQIAWNMCHTPLDGTVPTAFHTRDSGRQLTKMLINAKADMDPAPDA